MRFFKFFLLLAIVGVFLLGADGTGTVPATLGATINPTDRIQLVDFGAGNLPKAINNVGQVAGQSNGQAFFWSNGTLTPLGTLGGSQSVANDVNDFGVVVGWSHNAAGQRKAFKWTNADGFTNLGIDSALESVAERLDNTGEIVGWRTNGTDIRANIWTNAIPKGLPMFTGETGNHKIVGVNDVGQMVGVTLDSNGNTNGSFYYDGSSGTGNFSGQFDSHFFPIAGLNNERVTAGTYLDQGAYRELGISQNLFTIGKLSLSDDFSAVYGMNDLGVLAGESGAKGVLFDIATTTLFNINDFSRIGFDPYSIVRLLDINNDGSFVGIALVNGVEHGIVGHFVPVPEPNSLTLTAIGFLATVMLYRNRQ